MASRNIEDCTLSLQRKIKAFAIAMNRAGIPFIITCTARTVAEQFALWAQGRKSLNEVNRLREIAGLAAITDQQNKYKVTWTLKSEHLVDLDDGNPDNDKSRAFDIAITRDGKPVWDVKVDVNGDRIPDYMQAGKIGESVGLHWGGRFSKPDYPHFQDA
ncbi:L-alanyl-D-glutamate peptidase [Smithella sp. ME-1]|uniref:L-alanoyl-d-glutamate peptidase n=1 Tax=hydrocarbon metagenome TaxID=938273 RepID=A0A0W8FPT9_9ZZZZ|nr:L-alanyl-D-glutamate peptidase [Smithella sp. ME-1]